jgi:hypothetical protein
MGVDCERCEKAGIVWIIGLSPEHALILAYVPWSYPIFSRCSADVNLGLAFDWEALMAPAYYQLVVPAVVRLKDSAIVLKVGST